VKRFYVIDALRSVLALWVAIGHAGVFPLFGAVGQNDGLLDFLARGLRTLVWGPPAVIVFFVISGFCIHYPFAENARRCPILNFYARRYLRILIPVAFTVAMFKILIPETVIIGQDSILWHSTLWSVLCEEIYYALYPYLNRASLTFGLATIFKAAFVIAVPIAWLYSPAQEWQDLGIVGMAVVLFPVWLLGCYLAEHVSSLEKDCSRRAIWTWRLSAWAVMWIAEMLHFHGGISQTRTSIWMGVFAYFWLRAEITYFKHRTPWPVLVRAGRWSYSLYLIHPLVIALCFKFLFLTQTTRLNSAVMMALILAASYLCYLVVERPSHNLARKIPLFYPDEPTPAGGYIKVAEQATSDMLQPIKEAGVGARLDSGVVKVPSLE
jgi:peptidoglycan/LPS O-acetylase OafA/YrhL